MRLPGPLGTIEPSVRAGGEQRRPVDARHAIGIGFDQIQNSKNPVALIVGSDPVYLPTFAGFYALKAMREEPCCPFSGTPGMSVGEGAGALVREEYEHAKARGATIYGEIIGYATSSDAHHETAPDPRAEGATLVMRAALRNAGVGPEAIGYINAHGTGTEANDRATQVRAGRAYARAQLAATAHGLAMHPLQQALQEYPEQAPHYVAIHALLGAGGGRGTVQMWARLGYAPPVGPAPRRGVQAHVLG